MRNKFGSAALLFSALASLLTLACGSVPETHYYTIGRIVPEAGSYGQRLDYSVGVPQFEAEGIYARDNLLYRRGNYEIAADYYRRWGVPPQKMLAEATVTYLRKSELFTEVRRMPTMSRTDLVLSGRILCFEEVAEPTGPAVKMDLEFSLQYARGGERLWREEVSATSPITVLQSPDAVVAAVENCVRSCLDQALRSLAQASSKLSSSAK